MSLCVVSWRPEVTRTTINKLGEKKTTKEISPRSCVTTRDEDRLGELDRTE